MRPVPDLPTRSLPQKPDLNQLRKQAKDLFKSYRAGRKAAIEEVERFERTPHVDRFRLADAQRILARAYGFPSWTRLKEYVDGVNVETLCAAAESGDLVTVRRLIRRRPELINVQRGGRLGEATALHFAVMRRDPEITRVLMKFDANAHAGIWPHRDATTAWAIARERGYDEIVAILEQEEVSRRRTMSKPGASIGAATDEIQRAIMHGRFDDAKRLIELDPSLVGACNVRGVTPLHVAAWVHEPDLITWLLERQAPADARDLTGQTPLDYAAFVAGWSAHGRHGCYMENSHKPLSQFREVVQLLLSHGASYTMRAAVAIGDLQAVRQRHLAGRLKNDIHLLRGGLLSIAVRVNQIEMVRLLLDLGLDPNESVLGEDGSLQSWGMPLWFAALCDRLDIAKLLLSRGADVNAVVYASGDAFGMAEDDQMQALLRRHGAWITVEQVTDHETARGILNGTIAAHSLNVENPTQTDLAEQMLWAAAGDPERIRICLPYIGRKKDDPWWNYVLLHARQLEGFRTLLDYGIDPDVLGSDGDYTLLHHVASAYADEATRTERARLLLHAGASLGKRDRLLKSTPLGWACRWGRRELVELYLDRGANPYEPDAESWATPLAWASKGQHPHIMELLRSRMEPSKIEPLNDTTCSME